MYKLGYYPGNGSLNSANTKVTFDILSGNALFTNLAVDKLGMYMFSLRIFSAGNEFSGGCYSNALTVVKSISNHNITSSPNYKLKFNGDFYNLTKNDINELKANAYNYISNYGIGISNINVSAGSVYITFYSIDSNQDLLKELIKNGLNISSTLVFISADVNGQIYSYEFSLTKSVTV